MRRPRVLNSVLAGALLLALWPTAAQLQEVVGALNAILDTEVPAFNKLTFDNGMGKIEAGRRIP